MAEILLPAHMQKSGEAGTPAQTAYGRRCRMIFQHTAALVLAGVKTQTRRPVARGGDFHQPPRSVFTDGECVEIVYGLCRNRWRVGQTLAVQPGRGQRAIARIRVTAIRYEARAGAISEVDARAEGYDDPAAFGAVWQAMHGAAALDQPCWCLTFDKLPSISDLRGIDPGFTGGMDAADYVRRMRDGGES